MKHYAEIEHYLTSCTKLVIDILTDVERQEVSEFIHVGEYGLALITFVDIIEDNSRQVSDEVLQLLKKSGEAMQGDDEQIDEVLTRLEQLLTH